MNAKIQALKHGAYDYLEKPITRETLSIIVDRVLGKIDLIRELKRLQSQEPKVSHGNIITRSPALLAILKKAEKVAETDVTVLLTGETGTGKELVARYIFSMSRRRQAPFVPVNCAAIPKELIESELFGHVKGSFTGAIERQDGHLRGSQWRDRLPGRDRQDGDRVSEQAPEVSDRRGGQDGSGTIN